MQKFYSILTNQPANSTFPSDSSPKIFLNRSINATMIESGIASKETGLKKTIYISVLRTAYVK